MQHILIAVVVAAQASLPLAGTDVPVFGRLAQHLSPQDLAAISEAAGSPLFAVLGTDSLIHPKTWRVDAFLPPREPTGRLRRGRLVQLECMPVDTTPRCLEWAVVSDDGEYGQVADDPAGFAPDTRVRSPNERPIRISGDFTDEEFLSLVDYIRSKPSIRKPSPDGGEIVGPLVLGVYPIESVAQTAAGTVLVVMSLGDRIGETATVIREGDGWRLLKTVGWVV